VVVVVVGSLVEGLCLGIGLCPFPSCVSPSSPSFLV
jgi:hypothetical protein